MNNKLKSNRKPPIFKCLILAENVAKDTAKMLGDENKFPKRKLALYGTRFANNSMDCYESLREANEIFPDTESEAFARLDAGMRSEKAINNLISDIKILPEITGVCKESDKWYTAYQCECIECKKSIHGWRRKEKQKLNGIIAEKRREKQAKKAEIRKEIMNKKDDTKNETVKSNNKK